MVELDASAAFREIVAKQEIAQVIAALQRGIDRRDLELLRSAFHADAAVNYGFFDGAAAEFCELMAGGDPPAPPRITMHRPANVWIKLDGDRARSESYVFVLSPQSGAGGEEQALIGGRYLDRHERRDGAWRLTHRTYVLDWNINWAGTGTALPDYSGPFIRGGYRGADPGAKLLAEWGVTEPRNDNGGGTVEISAGLAARAEAALAKIEIHELICAQARATDRGDEALLRSLWHPGATVDVGDFYSGDADAYCSLLQEVVRNMDRMAHTVANEWIRVNGDDAVAESYVIAVTTTDTEHGKVDALNGGRYLDRFKQVDGAWKYTHRTYVVDWVIEQPSSDRRDDPESMYAALTTRGTLYPDDPVYAFWND